MKPTIIRNRTIYGATHFTRSKLLSSHLSKELQQKYNRNSIRITEGDTVRVMRGEFKGVTGKITKVSTKKNGAAVEGVKKEKLKGGNLDVFIHTSNLLVTDLNTEDKWRQNKLEGKNTKPVKEQKPKEEKPQPKPEPKPQPKQESKKEVKETKETKKPQQKISKKKEATNTSKTKKGDK